MKSIRVAAVVIRDARGRVLTVRKRGTRRFMLPGGKPESGEAPLDTALREVREEIGIDLSPEALRSLGRFTGPAANEAGWEVCGDIFLWEATGAGLSQAPRPAAEIEELRWLTPRELREGEDIAPLLQGQIVLAL